MDEPERCRATARSGRRCRRFPVRGATVCALHGGKAPQVVAAARKRREQSEALTIVSNALKDAYGEQVPPIDPGEALLQAVSWKHAEVLALRARVALLDEPEMAWGKTREKIGGDDQGTTSEAKPNIWLILLHEAESKLVEYSAAALKAGVEERRVRIAEEQGDLVSAVIRRILDGMLAALLAAGMAPTLEQSWAAAVGEVVPRELRAIRAEAVAG